MEVIGLDFGNYNSFTCFIAEKDADTRLGGRPHELLPAGRNDGIPSVYFYSEKTGELCGENAVTNRARPFSDRLRYLKFHLGETTVLDHRTIQYDDAITKVIQHCVRSANKKMSAGFQRQTNQLALSYPASYSTAQLQKLIELAQKATLEDGRHVEVCGTIREPAAAALDYLAEYANDKDTTVLTYDLGGGTFDLALLSAYPSGRKDADGDTYYYDIIDVGGLEDVGGKDFDEVIYNLMLSKIDVPLNKNHEDRLREEAEERKKELSRDESMVTIQDLMVGDDILEIEVTRDEFERESAQLLEKTVGETIRFLNRHKNQAPEIILLTGGASQMPMVKNALENALPAYKGRIVFHRPEKAIAFGAARYGIVEKDPDPTRSSGIIIQRTAFDIGIQFINPEDDQLYIATYIPAGTRIPFKGEYQESRTRKNQNVSYFGVHEAVKAGPDANKISEDFREIMNVRLTRERTVPPGTVSETKLSVDKMGVLHITARDKDYPDRTVKAHVTLQNLSSKREG